MSNNSLPLKEVVIVFTTMELCYKGTWYPINHVLRYDFEGTLEDLKDLISSNEHLFIEGDQMVNLGTVNE